jgi:hypothetical protein
MGRVPDGATIWLEMRHDIDSAGVYYMTRAAFESRSAESTPAMKQTGTCEECLSRYYSELSQMKSLCPECAHRLHGYPPCNHRFLNGRCELCYWDGSVSDFVTTEK